MRLFNPVPLLLDKRAALARDIRVHHAFEGGLRGIFARFASGDNAARLAARERGFQIHPAAMKRARETAVTRRRAAQPFYFLFQLPRESGTLSGILFKDAAELRVTHVPSRCLIAQLPVFADLDQPAQMVNSLFMSHSVFFAYTRK